MSAIATACDGNAHNTKKDYDFLLISVLRTACMNDVPRQIPQVPAVHKQTHLLPGCERYVFVARLLLSLSSGYCCQRITLSTMDYFTRTVSNCGIPIYEACVNKYL